LTVIDDASGGNELSNEKLSSNLNEITCSYNLMNDLCVSVNKEEELKLKKPLINVQLHLENNLSDPPDILKVSAIMK
jgi:hypothetical protein